MEQNKNYPWIKSYPETLSWDAKLEYGPVFELLQNAAKDYGQKPAMDFLGKKYNWQEIHDLAAAFAKGLQDEGFKKGSHIGIFLPNCPYFLVAYYGILMSGATVVNLNPLYAEEELSHLIEDSEMDIVVTADVKLLYDKMEKMLSDTRLRKIIVCRFTDILPFPKNILFQLFKGKDLASPQISDRVIHYDKIIESKGSPELPDVNPDEDLAVLQFTGGTTGLPKAAMLTHKNIYVNAIQSKNWFTQVDRETDKMLGVLPFSHVFGMTAIMNFSVANALEIVALPRFELKDALKTIAKKEITLFPCVPAILSAMNASPLVKADTLKSLRFCLSGGAPLPHEVKTKFEERSNCMVVEGYGLTESSPVVCAKSPEGVYKANSIGLPFQNTIVEILDRENKTTPMPIGERGELCIRGPQVMKGYWKKPEGTAETLRDTGEGDKRLHTGDVAIMDEEGYIFIVDRIKDMIITNGYNVYPRNVEEAIYRHPNIEECIVAGLPDENRGEIVKAWIKLHDGRELSADDLKEFLRDKISPMEIPKKIEFRSEPLPKTMVGKLSRKDILAQEKSRGVKAE